MSRSLIRVAQRLVRVSLLHENAIDSVDTRLVQLRLRHSSALGFYPGALLSDLGSQFSALSVYLSVKTSTLFFNLLSQFLAISFYLGFKAARLAVNLPHQSHYSKQDGKYAYKKSYCCDHLPCVHKYAFGSVRCLIYERIVAYM